MVSGGKLYTAQDLAELAEDGRRFELVDGVLREMSPPTWRHGRITYQISRVLGNYVEAQDLGEIAVGDPGIALRRGPDTVRGPDIAFIARQRLPSAEVDDRYLDVIPDFIVEVVSSHDSASEVLEKVEAWLRAGVQLACWVAYPRPRVVIAYRGLQESRTYREDDEIDAEPVLPGFKAKVGDLFP
ncbi:MAG: Uma2 family endonuclease [Chloroflexi bacterium]|nr:Uma2 family endonuclease [Chloroflexota bacterium]